MSKATLTSAPQPGLDSLVNAAEPGREVCIYFRIGLRRVGVVRAKHCRTHVEQRIVVAEYLQHIGCQKHGISVSLPKSKTPHFLLSYPHFSHLILLSADGDDVICVQQTLSNLHGLGVAPAFQLDKVGHKPAGPEAGVVLSVLVAVLLCARGGAMSCGARLGREGFACVSQLAEMSRSPSATARCR